MTANPDAPVQEGEDLVSVCPVSAAFESIGSKWRLAVLHTIHIHGEQRFSELQENTTADSSTLSRVLGELEERDFVDRRLEDRPIATYYRLTPKGQSLASVFEAIEAWAEEWTDIESADDTRRS